MIEAIERNNASTGAGFQNKRRILCRPRRWEAGNDRSDCKCGFENAWWHPIYVKDVATVELSKELLHGQRQRKRP